MSRPKAGSSGGESKKVAGESNKMVDVASQTWSVPFGRYDF
jgi:hypothetical protein